MNRDQFASKWHELKNKVKQKWAKLMDDDIAHINGRFEELSSRIQKRYGWSKEMTDREITNWCSSCEKDSHCCGKDGRDACHNQSTKKEATTQCQWSQKSDQHGKDRPHNTNDNKNRGHNPDKKRKAG